MISDLLVLFFFLCLRRLYNSTLIMGVYGLNSSSACHPSVV